MPVGSNTEIDLGVDALLAGERNGDHLATANFTRHRKRRQQRGGGVAQHQFLQHFQRAGDEDRVKFDARIGKQRIEGLTRSKTLVRQRKRQARQFLQRDFRLGGERVASGEDDIITDAGARTHLDA
ncbi:hypothetical protein D3C72_1387140 [compost metagenome]